MRIERRLSTVRVKFPFEKYIQLILAALPPNDLIGINEIRIVEKFSNSKNPENTLACYRLGSNPRDAAIEIHLPRFMEHKVVKCVFESHPEIAAYILSITLCHEIGHHAHRSWRHGVKKPNEEQFADNYARAGSLSYLKSRSSRILSSYRWASRNFLLFGKESRKIFRKARREVVYRLKKNKNGAKFL